LTKHVGTDALGCRGSNPATLHITAKTQKSR
jgi:hypothetical protein